MPPAPDSIEKIEAFTVLLIAMGWSPPIADNIARMGHPRSHILTYDRFGRRPMPRHALLATTQALWRGIQERYKRGNEALAEQVLADAGRNIAYWRVAGTLVHRLPIVSIAADVGPERGGKGYSEDVVRTMLRVVVEMTRQPDYYELEEAANALSRSAGWDHCVAELRDVTVTLRVPVSDLDAAHEVVARFAALARTPCGLEVRDDERVGTGVRAALREEQTEDCLEGLHPLHSISAVNLPVVVTAAGEP